VYLLRFRSRRHPRKISLIKSELPEILRQFEVWEPDDDNLLRVILSAQLALCIRPVRTTICSEPSDNRICAAAAFRVVLLFLWVSGAW
jgi:hypothetical protein